MINYPEKMSYIQLCYGCTNTVIASFVTDLSKSHMYLSLNNASWTIATFMFFGVGYLMKVGNIWLFLEVSFIAFMIMAILDLIFLPKISSNKYNLTKSNSNLSEGEEAVTVSIKNDLTVIFKIKPFWIATVSLICIFIAWGYFYVSFGLWLKELFHLNQATFGYIAGFAEGFGNLFAILTVTFITKDDENKDKNQSWKLSLQAMMMITSIIMMCAIGIIWFIIYVSWYNEIFIYIIIGIYFYGLEACTASALILMVNVVPALQQARSSSMIGIMQSFTLFTAQATVAPLYQNIGMQWESLILLILYAINVIVVIYLNLTMKQIKLKEEFIWINKDKNDIQKYT